VLALHSGFGIEEVWEQAENVKIVTARARMRSGNSKIAAKKKRGRQ
jgi:hypothetical protein